MIPTCTVPYFSYDHVMHLAYRCIRTFCILQHLFITIIICYKYTLISLNSLPFQHLGIQMYCTVHIHYIVFMTWICLTFISKYASFKDNFGNTVQKNKRDRYSRWRYAYPRYFRQMQLVGQSLPTVSYYES